MCWKILYHQNSINTKVMPRANRTFRAPAADTTGEYLCNFSICSRPFPDCFFHHQNSNKLQPPRNIKTNPKYQKYMALSILLFYPK